MPIFYNVLLRIQRDMNCALNTLCLILIIVMRDKNLLEKPIIWLLESASKNITKGNIPLFTKDLNVQKILNVHYTCSLLH